MSRPVLGEGARTLPPDRSPPPPDLLRQLMTATVDPDYALVHGRSEPARSSSTTWRAAAAAVVIALGLLVAAAAVERVRSQPQLDRDRDALVAQVQQVRTSIANTQTSTALVRADVQAMQGSLVTPQDPGVLGASLSAERMLSGTVPVTGPGLRIVVDDAVDAMNRREGQVLDTDLQVLVNGLWESGAEAISVNRNRLGPLSSIRVAGEAITVNYRSLSPPYVVEAVGDPATLQARFVDTAAGQTWLDLQTNFGLVFRPDEREQLTLPAAPEASLGAARLQGDLP